MSSGAPTVRRANASDAMSIGLVHVRSWQAAYRGRFPHDYLDALDPVQRGEGWQRYLEGGRPGDREAVLVTDTASGVVGFANVGPSRDEDGDGEVRAIYLLADQWGHGLGRSLMQAAVDTLVAFGFRQATLWVLDTNERARRFYEAGGWAPDGATKCDDTRGFSIAEVRYRRQLP